MELAINLPEKVHERLEQLVKDSKSKDISDMTARAFSLFDLVIEHKNEGGKLIFRHDDGTEEELKI